LKQISRGILAYCLNLESAYLPEVEYIGFQSFMFSRSLTSQGLYVPNLRIIGEAGLRGTSLDTIFFPHVTEVRGGALSISTLKCVNLPLVRMVGSQAFWGSDSIQQITLGLGFTEHTEILFANDTGFASYAVFGYDSRVTRNIDLTLGEYVLPKPNFEARTWQSNNPTPNAIANGRQKIDYRWKSITIKYVSIEEDIAEDKIIIYNLDNNIYYISSDDILELELYDVLGRKIKTFYKDEKIIDINNLPIGLYFLRYFDGKVIKIHKLNKHN